MHESVTSPFRSQQKPAWGVCVLPPAPNSDPFPHLIQSICKKSFDKRNKLWWCWFELKCANNKTVKRRNSKEILREKDCEVKVFYLDL